MFNNSTFSMDRNNPNLLPLIWSQLYNLVYPKHNKTQGFSNIFSRRAHISLSWQLIHAEYVFNLGKKIPPFEVDQVKKQASRTTLGYSNRILKA